MSIRNVILIGASGNLGPSILEEIVDAKFAVSILTRQESKSTFPSDLKVHRTDYSLDSLVSAFKGQDAVISTVGAEGFAQQKIIIDAAVKAGVKRFIPSEFGSNTENKKSQELVPLFKGKLEVVAYLQQVAKDHPSFSYTAIATGPFFDWGVKNGFLGYDLANRKATIFDAGDRKVSFTNLSTIGKSVAGVLSHLKETENKTIYVASVTASQNEVLAALESATGSKFTVEKRSAVETSKEGLEKLGKGDHSAIVELIRGVAYQEGTGQDFEKEVPGGTANAVLGLPKETLEGSIKAIVSSL
ncbi:hypothetical protein HKX48_002107 [Thoreauomyces humboldtii]|nr:hypothetical protein HKX48_002107 [Thoreauomyces humboldtii]